MAKAALLFDIDDTLYDQVIPFGAAYERAFPDIFGQGPSAEELFAARSRHSEHSFRKALGQEMTMEEMYRYRIREALAEFGYSVSDWEADRFQQIYEQTQRELKLSPVMEEILTYCKNNGVLLGVISNGPGAHQREKAKTLGLGRYMEKDHVIVSGDVGFVKPDVRIFRLAEKRLGLNPADTWYAGESFANDIVGAAQAGWHTIWLNRRQKTAPACGPAGAVRPEVTAADEDMLLAWLRQKKWD